MRAHRIHLLLVEDDDLDVMNVHRALSTAAEVASITVARDGRELLRRGQLPKRLVVADLRLREIRADAKLERLPIVVLSTSDDPNDREAAYCLGCAGYFVKPAAPGRFRQIMDAMRSYWSGVEFPPFGEPAT